MPGYIIQYFDKTKNDYVEVATDQPLPLQLTGSNVTLTTRQEGTTNLLNGAVTVGSTQTELKVNASPLAGRTQMIVYPPNAGVIYWGATGVTAANGAPLAAGSQPITFTFDPKNPLSIFAINDGTNRDVKVVEAK